jgi:hypothetical protein
MSNLIVGVASFYVSKTGLGPGKLSNVTVLGSVEKKLLRK